jgi:PRC-barrel domain
MKHEHMSRTGRFERLSRMRDCTVARDQIDPRGWKVLNVEGHTVGEVKDLIVDADRMTGAYLDVELDRKAFDLHDDPRVLVPMARAHRDCDHRRLIVEGLTRERVAELRFSREAHMREFWNRWWELDRAGTADWSPRITDTTTHEDLHRAVENMRPGETVRIPVVKEEIVVERRVVSEVDHG